MRKYYKRSESLKGFSIDKRIWNEIGYEEIKNKHLLDNSNCNIGVIYYLK